MKEPAMKRIIALVVLSLLWVVSFTAQAEEAGKVVTQMADPGKPLFASDFAKEKEADWKATKGKWVIEDGSLKAAEVKEDMHGAVMRRTLGAADIIISYEFRLQGCKGTSLSFNDAKGHNSRVSISAKGMSVRKDDHDHEGPDKAVNLQNLKVEIKEGVWHTLVVEIVGSEIVATLDGKHVAMGSHEAIGVSKTNVGLTVSGESAMFRNFKVFAATKKKDWADTKARLSAKPAK